MADIHTTINRYEMVCAELGVRPHPYVMKMLNIEKAEVSLVPKVEDEDVHRYMHLYLAGNNKLLTDTRLVDADALVLYQSLCNNLYVTTMDLRYNNIGDKGAKHLATLIEESACLADLNLMCNEITDVGASHLAKAVQNNVVLQGLRLTGNKIGNKGGMHFAQALQVNIGLRRLDLADCDLGSESIIALATVLHHNRSLRSLNINRPLLHSHQEDAVVHVALMLKVNITLESISLQKYNVRDFGATRLAENLMHNLTLNHLDLSCNRITRDGVKELSKVLKNNTGLRVLDLGYNRLENDGASHLAEALATYNTTLDSLSVVSNGIESKGLCSLVDCLRKNTSLMRIYIWGNQMDNKSCEEFASLISSGRLELRDTDIQPYVVDGVTYVSELSHGLRKDYYWAASYGDDVPHWQPRGHNPRSAKVN